MLKLLARHLLLVAVVIGLAGQSAASASTPCGAMVKSRASLMAGMADCGPMNPVKTGKFPCKARMAGCLAMASCAALIVIDAPEHLVVSPTPPTFAATWPASPVLTGREIAPDPDPPSLLG